MKRLVGLAIAVCVLATLPGRAGAQAGDPNLAALTQPVNLSAPETDLGHLLSYLSRQTGVSLMVDPRLEQVPIGLLGGEGPLGDILIGIEQATHLQFRRVGDTYLLVRDRRGTAAIAHAQRREQWSGLAARQRQLQAEVDQRVALLSSRLGLSAEQAYRAAGLNAGQLRLLQQQGYLTDVQLRPPSEYEEFLRLLWTNYAWETAPRDSRGRMLPSWQAEAMLGEAPRARLYFRPTLALQLGLPVEGHAEPYVWDTYLLGSALP
jgi:hypothetical protein